MKKHIIIFLAIIISFSLSANDNIKRHGISAHLGGTISLFEFGYQYNFLSLNNHQLSANIGINTAILSFGIPVGLEYSYGKNNKFILGIKAMPFWSIELFPGEGRMKPSPIMYSLKLGYGRMIHPKGQDYLLSFYASPVFDLDNKRMIPWGGISITHCF